MLMMGQMLQKVRDLDVVLMWLELLMIETQTRIYQYVELGAKRSVKFGVGEDWSF